MDPSFNSPELQNLRNQEKERAMMSEVTSAKYSGTDGGGAEPKREETRKPHFRPAKDDTKPPLRDPILRSDPIETEEAVLRLPPLPDNIKSR